MTTYTCKCGKTFQKNTGAGTTGNRMPNYGPGHECFGCPFVIPITEGWPAVTVNHECRGSSKVRYDTYCRIGTAEKDFCVSHVWTLDLEFAKRITEFFNTLEGIEQPQKTDFICRASENTDDGTIDFGFFFQHNKRGTASKGIFYNAFFKDNRRIDVTPEQEKEIVLRQIKEAKAMAQGISDNPEFTVAVADMFESAGPSMTLGAEPNPLTQYRHGSRIYYVRPYQNGSYRAFFYFEYDPTVETVCSTISGGDTPEIAQKMLDDYAQKHDYEVFTEPTSEAETPLESDLSSDDTPAEAADVSEDSEYVAQQEQDDTPDNVQNEVGFENDSVDPDSEPCDWKNASGADEDEDEESSVPKNIVEGERVSLRNSEFDDILDAADGALNDLIRTLRDKKQHDGELNIKVLFEDYGTAFRFSGNIGGKINYSLKTVKVNLDDNVEIKFDEFGNPVIPYDRQHQISFDDIQPGRIIPPVTTTVDGDSGLVDDVQINEDDDEDPPTSDDITNEVVGDDLDEEPPQLCPCDYHDCPFYAVPDDESEGCCFSSENRDDGNFPADVWTAVNMEHCIQPDVLDAYRMNNPEEDYDESNDFPDDSGDLPFDMQENYEEDNSDEN